MIRALPSCSIGILGSGQLGRMLAMAAYELGMEVHVFAPDADCSPAGAIAHSAIGASYEDEQALLAFADGVDCITYEFENIPADTVSILEKTGKLFPNAKALHIAQDRLMEKNFFQSLSIPHAEFQSIDKVQELMDAFASESRARILKIRTLGYDGHGQWRIASQEEAEIAAKELNNRPAILEEIIPFTKELSVIIARERGGEIAAYEASENIHENQILHHSKVPANIEAGLAEQAYIIAAKIVSKMEYVGVMGVEMFYCEGKLLVNEIAPRVHNSGHWTQDFCFHSQFSQHIRAIAGLPLASTLRHSEGKMVNLLGDDVQDMEAYLKNPKAHIHLYGKKTVRKGRKMGHVNIVK